MNEEVSTALREAVKRSLPVLASLAAELKTPHLVWSRTENGGMRGEYKDSPDLLRVFITSEEQTGAITSEFHRVFKNHHPEYDDLVGLDGFASMNLLCGPLHLINTIFLEVWNRYGTFACGENEVDNLLQEFEDFVDSPTTRVRFVAPLRNLRTETDVIPLPGEVVIRKLSEKELTEIYGGPSWKVAFGPNRMPVLDEYVLEGTFEARKVFGKPGFSIPPTKVEVWRKLERSILALRTFKEGRVGCDHIQYQPVKYCPLLPGGESYSDGLIQFGSYSILKTDIDALQRHATMICSRLDPSMELACLRLGDAQMRLRPQDQLLDAVIGLESLLLAQLGNQERRGELRLRFGLNYASLFSGNEERYRAFVLARDLYDLRSSIVHGGLKADACKLGEEKVPIRDAASRACGVLRDLIQRLLFDEESIGYRRPMFWERRIFGLPPDLDP